VDIGDIYTVEIPPSDGHEQAGIRPAIIVQDAEFNKRLPTVLVVPLTSNLVAQAFPSTFLIQPNAENVLRLPSVVLVFQLRAIDKRRLRQKVGRFSSAHLAELQRHMMDLLGQIGPGL
jgi:mRNA interferase MazF